MSHIQRWWKETQPSGFRNHGIYADQNGRSHMIAAYYREAVAEEKHRNPLQSEASLKERVERSYARREEDGTWEISEIGLKALEKKRKDDKCWTSAGNLREHFSCSVEMTEALIQRYANHCRGMLVQAGVVADLAEYKVDKEVASLRKNANGMIAWHIHNERIEDFKAWARQDREKWVSATDRARLRDLKIPGGGGLSPIIEDLYLKDISYLTENGESPEKARLIVETVSWRQGINSHFQEVWQFHKDMVPVLQRRMEFVGATNNSKLLNEYGISAHRETVKKAMQNLHEKEIQDRIGQGMDPIDARKDVEQNIVVCGKTAKGTQTWMVHPDYIPALKIEIGEIKSWISAVNSRLQSECGIKERDSGIITLAMAYLHSKEVKAKEKSGMEKDTARQWVEDHAFRLNTNIGKSPLWEMHKSYMPQLKTLVDSPDRGWIADAKPLMAKEARTSITNGQAIGKPIETYFSLRGKGSKSAKPSWIERLDPQNIACYSGGATPSP